MSTDPRAPPDMLDRQARQARARQDYNGDRRSRASGAGPATWGTPVMAGAAPSSPPWRFTSLEAARRLDGIGASATHFGGDALVEGSEARLHAVAEERIGLEVDRRIDEEPVRGRERSREPREDDVFLLVEVAAQERHILTHVADEGLARHHRSGRRSGQIRGRRGAALLDGLVLPGKVLHASTHRWIVGEERGEGDALARVVEPVRVVSHVVERIRPEFGIGLLAVREESGLGLEQVEELAVVGVFRLPSGDLSGHGILRFGRCLSTFGVARRPARGTTLYDHARRDAARSE